MKLKQMLMNHALYSPDDPAGAAPSSDPPAGDPTPPPAAPADPPPVTFTQEQVNDLLAKERATATRKAKQAAKATPVAPPVEPPSGAAQVPVADDRLDKLIGVVEGLVTSQSDRDQASEFTSAIVGLTMDENEAAIAPTLFKHDKTQFEALVARVKLRDAPPDPKGPGFQSPGAPAPNAVTGIGTDPKDWSADDVEVLRASGQLLPTLKNHRDGLTGGRGKLFPAKIPGGSSK